MAEFNHIQRLCYDLSIFFSRKASDTQFLQSMRTQVPKDFPVDSYESVLKNLIQSNINVRNNDEQFRKYEQFLLAWQSVAYRYRTLTFNDYEFSTSIRKYGIRPDRYRKEMDLEIQDLALFSFFTNSCSFVDSLCYSLYALGSIKDPLTFPMQPKTLSHLYPEIVCDKFKAMFKTASISNKLDSIVHSEQYAELKMIRNTLIHRSLPDRRTYPLRMSPDIPFSIPVDYWPIEGIIKDFKLNTNGKPVQKYHVISLVGRGTHYYREWLSGLSQETFDAINDFIITDFKQAKSETS
jgi:hypothetical protein